MLPPDLYCAFIKPLHEAGVAYMVTGSVASIAYGEPRMTLDVDMVVFLNKGELSYDGPVKPLLEKHMKQTWRILIPDMTNFSSSFVSTRKNLGAGIEQLEVESSHKDLVVKQIISEGISILGLEQEKVRLEEIFYKTGIS